MSMEMLHEGLYFVEYTPRIEGTYIFHMVAFSQGTQSHGSAATLVLGQDIAGISKQIITLNEVITTASDELSMCCNLRYMDLVLPLMMLNSHIT